MLKATNAATAAAVVVAVALGAGFGWLLNRPLAPQPPLAPTQANAETRVLLTSSSTARPGQPVAKSANSAVPSRPTRNLFADYQRALGSSDQREMELGLAAWRKCVTYVGAGTEDVNAHVAYVVPPGLPRDDEYKRSQFARASAAACAGFALQADSMSQVQGLSDKAIALGSASEEMAIFMRTYHDDAPSKRQTLRDASCKVVHDYPQSGSAIHQVLLAAHYAAQKRPSHMFNQVERKNRRVALGLAKCDLDPASCGPYSDTLGSACIQSGKCDYANELDYWRAETPPAIYAAAQPLRQSFVAAVNQRNCAKLFD